MNLADLYHATRVATPAASEAEWQERHSELPLDATLYAGDRYSTQKYIGQREVQTDAGPVLRSYLVDEYGRRYLDSETLWPIEVWP